MKKPRTFQWIVGCFSIILIAAAISIGFSIYGEGENAHKEAQNLLDQYNNEISEDFNEENIVEIETLSGYQVIGKLLIEKIGVELPVISQTNDNALQVSACYYQGPEPGEAGNLVITGHNYTNGAHFGKLDKLKEGDLLVFETPKGDVYTYEIYEILIVKPDNTACLEEYHGEHALTLVTCTQQGNRRLLVKSKLI